MNTYDVTMYHNKISTTLSSYYNDTILCQQYAWWIMSALTKKTEAQLIAHKTIMLSLEQEQQLKQWLDELINHAKPLQYILGSVPFCNVDILVEPPVLIPRPETEELCEHLITHIKTLKNTNISILDLATGSGCIAIALAHAFPQARVLATDISQKALELTEKNIEHNHTHNVTLLQSDLFQSIPQGLQFDLIVSNPPYIAESEWKNLEPSVKNWEDKNALIAKNNGLEVIQNIIEQAPYFIKQNKEMKENGVPQLCIEFDSPQADEIKTLAHHVGYNEILIHKDLEKKDRFFTGRIDNVATNKTNQ